MDRKALMSVAVLAALVAGPAEARFGKSGGGRSSSSSHGSSSHSSSSPSSSTHAATPVGGGSSYSGGYGYGGYGGGGYYGGGYGYYRPHWYSGYYFGGAFVPYYGYGWGYPTGYATATTTAGSEQPSAPLRVTTGVEAQGFLSGFTLGVAASLEGERWGFAVAAQNMSLRKDNGQPGFDNLQAISAHLTFALLTGQYGRLRVEGGADSIFAPDIVVLGPTAGVSGVIWVGGPFAIEGSAMYTPWPFPQVDGKAGLAIGIGAIGLRAGWRFQLLNDQGRAGGTANTDILNGPYVGISAVF